MKKVFTFVLFLAMFILCPVCYADGLKIAIVTALYDVHDGSFTETNYNGVLEFIRKNPESTV